MSAIHRSKTVSFSAREMYELVNDVQSYPAFLTWCADAKVIRREQNKIRARLSLASGKMKYSFTTDNMALPHKRIEMCLVNGPFKRLHGIWRFEDCECGCRVSLHLQFEFANKIAELALARVFNPIANSLVDAFTRRAEALYGARDKLPGKTRHNEDRKQPPE